MKKVISDDTVHQICGLIQEGKRNNEISKITGCHVGKISSIRHGKSFQYISKDYNLTIEAKKCIEDEDIIINICQLMQEGKRNNEISKITGYPDFKISQIRNKKIHKDISKNYNISFKTKRSNEKEIRQICQLIQDGMTNKEISKITGESCAVLTSIRTGLIYRDISKDYDLSTKPKLVQDNRKLAKDICILIEQGERNIDISIQLNCSPQLVSQIRNGIVYKYISKDYNISIEPRIKNDIKIHEICNMIEDGLSNNDIKSITNYNYQYINDIRIGLKHQDISKDYELLPQRTYKQKKSDIIDIICQLIQDKKIIERYLR